MAYLSVPNQFQKSESYVGKVQKYYQLLFIENSRKKNGKIGLSQFGDHILKDHIMV